MLGKLLYEFPNIYRYRLATELKFANTLKRNVKREYGTTDLHAKANTTSVDEELQEIFKFKDTNISNWIIENRTRAFCVRYTESNKDNRQQILRTLASRYAVQHDNIYQVARKLVCTELENERQMIIYERTLKNILMPAYHWLFVIMGRLQHGVKFLVDLRTDVLEMMSEVKDTDESVVIQQLNHTLRDLLLLWFSVGFLQMERITWESACDILQKISDYEAIHPIRNWLDLKRRVGPYRRCYIFMHPSMPREPIVVLHTALCDVIPDATFIFTTKEHRIAKDILQTESVISTLKKILGTSLWIKDKQLSEFLKEPLLRACAWYLYKEKRRGYALNTVANFHLRNGAVMWRINWMADLSPRGMTNSCGIMINYRYFLKDSEKNGQNYIEHFIINATEDIINLAAQAEKLRIDKT
ncbi:malonyl-CoA decarboxylase, mitochondrial isoform X3 [Monomorium pharaonis]|uniref:malonyl-CoA decarboxylase, mitochondrial isoform X3 n=1 Tax=Monomorium pharaonis TaxID=307658 RepID=UPI001745CC68|nr:malonyl-CoA decarboxylase, mitochondrial isoform X3 [Monomorium pharaonis]